MGVKVIIKLIKSIWFKQTFVYEHTHNIYMQVIHNKTIFALVSGSARTELIPRFLGISSRCRSHYIMTASDGNIFRVTGSLWGESTGYRWIPLTKASDAKIWYFYLRLNKRLSKQSRRRWFETPSRSLWRHYNVGDPVMVRIICWKWTISVSRLSHGKHVLIL